MNVSEKIAQYLLSLKIRHCFGIIGGGNVHLWNVLAKHFEIISTHHEQAAAQAATYYYRTCRQIAPVIVTTGGGSANAITGVMAAHMDSVPLVVISGNEKSHTMNAGTRVLGVQGYRSDRVASHFTKYACNIENAEEVLIKLSRCVSIATMPRYGATWLNIPQDIQRAVD